MTSRKISSLFLIFAFFAVVSSAQSPSKLLKKAEKVLGGGKSLKSAVWTATGTITNNVSGGQGRITVSSDGKGRYREM
ncbi:hypothetical protein J0671_25165, partial [Vibrio sp. Vb0592]|uniref:hypothetical protein n=1 Tax=Vibrio sp. Vb0592 TaxID=2816072 RepID=UPI001A8E70A4